MSRPVIVPGHMRQIARDLADDGFYTAGQVVTDFVDQYEELQLTLSTLERWASREWSPTDNTWPAVLAARAALAKAGL